MLAISCSLYPASANRRHAAFEVEIHRLLRASLQNGGEHLVADDVLLTLAVDRTRGRATLSIHEQRDLGAMREFCLLSLLRYVHGYACWAVDSRISLLEVGFPFPRPRHGDVYPLPETRFEKWYLSSKGDAFGSKGDGRLTREAPAAGAAPDRYTYDPADPTPDPDYY